MALMRDAPNRLGLVLVLASFATGGCQGLDRDPGRPWEQLLANHEESEARCWFLDLIRANGVEEAFQEAMSRPPVGKRHWDVEAVRTVPGTNGLVHVQLRPDPEYVPGLETKCFEDCLWPERFWFFFDRSGNLLKWSDDSAGTWLVVDVTGDGMKDLLVSSNSPKGLEAPQGTGDGRAYYTLYQTSTSLPKAIPFGASAVEGVSYGFALIYLRDCRVPLVMTYEAEFPVEDGESERDDWYGTVIRSFAHGEPRVIAAIPGRLTLCTSPGGEVVLLPEYEDAGDKVQYSPLKRRFEVERLESEPSEYLRTFSATVPR